MIKKIICIIPLLLLTLLFTFNNNSHAQSISNDNLASPDLQGKEYLGDGDYRLYNSDGLTVDYNVYNGVYTFNGLVENGAVLLRINVPNTQMYLKSYYVSGSKTVTSNPYVSIDYPNQANTVVIMPIMEQGFYINRNVESISLNTDINTSYNNYQFKLQLEQGTQATPYKVPLQPISWHEQQLYDNGYNAGYNDFYIHRENVRVSPTNSADTGWYELQFSYNGIWFDNLALVANYIINNSTEIGLTYKLWEFRYYMIPSYAMEIGINFNNIIPMHVITSPQWIDTTIEVFANGEASFRFDFYTTNNNLLYTYNDSFINNPVDNWVYLITPDAYIEAGLSYNDGFDAGVAISDKKAKEAFDKGYYKGLSDNQTEGGFGLLLSQVFVGIGSILSIELLPNMPIGAFIAVPIVFGIIFFIIGRKKE